MNDQSWSEETVTWNNAPAHDGTLVASLGAVTAGNWYSVDLTALISADGTYSLRVSSTSSDGADYSSKEGANPPVLEVEVAGGSTATPGATATATATFTQTASPTFTPTATATATATPQTYQMTYSYDGDGRMVKSVLGDVTTYYVGTHYEKTVQGSQQNERKYYFAGSSRIAMRENGVLTWLLSDHLGSTSVVTDASGNLLSSLRYTAFGEVRAASGTTNTDYLYTGQRNEVEIGLYFYVARFYDPMLGRFISADTVVPEPYNPMDWDRYSYVRNNPINLNDPSGNKSCSGWDDYGNCEPDDWYPTKWVPTNSGTSNPLLNPLTIVPNIEEIPLQDRPSINSNDGLNIGSSCTGPASCLDRWEQPSWWDTDPSHPDYYVFSISIGEVIGVTGNIIVDRYGNWYVGIGGNIGKSISPAVVSLNGGWIGSMVDYDMPDSGSIGPLISGLSINGQAGAMGDIAVNWSPPNIVSFEYGGVIPFSIGISATITFELINGAKRFR